MNLGDLMTRTKARLKDKGFPTADLDARFLVQDLLHLTSADILICQKELNLQQVALVENALVRRLEGEPVSRILGYREFWGRKFFLSSATLDPRPDTETLIETVLEHQWNKPHILDLGTGTGCILLTLLLEIPGSTGVGTDLSPEACVTARQNKIFHDLQSRAKIEQRDWTRGLTGNFDIIVSNPPYIPSKVIPTLDDGVRKYDPILALDGGNDGRAPYKFLLSNLRKFLAPGGKAFFEIGQGQADDLARLVSDSGATLSRVVKDLGGVERVVEITYGDK